MSTNIERAAEVIEREFGTCHDTVNHDGRQAKWAAEELAAEGLLVTDEQQRLDEAEEKIAFLVAGCMNMTRDELIEKIGSIGPARWKAGLWLTQRLEPLRLEIDRLKALTDEQQRLIRLGEAAAEWLVWNNKLHESWEEGDDEARLAAWMRLDAIHAEAERGGQ